MGPLSLLKGGWVRERLPEFLFAGPFTLKDSLASTHAVWSEQCSKGWVREDQLRLGSSKDLNPF